MTALPTSAHGRVDDNSVYWSQGYGIVVDALLDYVPEVTWPYSIRTYSRMRWDPQLRAVVQAYCLPIRRADWALDGAGCRDEVVADVADNLGLPILGTDPDPTGVRRRGVQWAEHLRLALLKLTFGHMAFSRWYDTSTQKARIAGVSERMPSTLEAIKLASDGSIEFVEQGLTLASGTQNRIQANELVWYANDREGSAWTGQSLLRSAYTPWLIKHELWRVHATSIRRFGMGIPQVNAPAGAQQNQIAEASRLATGYRSGDTSGVGLPNGFTMELKGMTGSVPDALAFINYLDKQMTRATLTSLLDMTDSTHGNRALGETFMDLLLMSLQTIADETAAESTAQLVIPLVNANYGEDEPAPRIVCGDVGSEHEVTAQTLQLLLSSGAIEPDPALDAYVRNQYKLPERDAAYPWAPPHSVPDPMTAVPTGAEPFLDLTPGA
jgi:hypothetical protein